MKVPGNRRSKGFRKKVLLFVSLSLLFGIPCEMVREVGGGEINPEPCQEVTLSLVDGSRVDGRLFFIGGDSLGVMVGGKSSRPTAHRYGCEEIDRIRYHDPVWNGTLIGFIAGTAAVGGYYLLVARGALTEDSAVEGFFLGLYGSVLLGGLPGAGVGALLDRIHEPWAECPPGEVCSR